MSPNNSLSDPIPAWIGEDLQPVEKLEVHQKGLKHLAVSVFVLSGRNVLIQKRARTKYHTPGLWANTCCTHPNWEEDARSCAIRRLDQELGIRSLEPVFRQRVSYFADVGGGLTENEVVDVFTAEASPDLTITLNPEEVEDTDWIDLDTLADEVMAEPARFTPWLKIYLSNHRAEIFGGGD